MHNVETTPPTITDAQLAEWARVCEAATAGPWMQTRDIASGVKIWPSAHGMGPLFAVLGGFGYSRVSDADPIPQWQKNADFVRLARTAMPALIHALQQERARADDAEKRCERLAGALSDLKRWSDSIESVLTKISCGVVGALHGTPDDDPVELAATRWRELQDAEAPHA